MVLAFWGGPAYADALVETLAELYSQWRAPSTHPGSLEPRIENLYFSLFVLQARPQASAVREMTFSQWGHVTQRAAERYRFRFSLQHFPFDAHHEFQKLLSATEPGNDQVCKALHAQILADLRAMRAAFPIPTVKVTVRPSLPPGFLPAWIPTLKDERVELTLNQAAGRLNRLASAFELIAQTDIGRAALGRLQSAVSTGDIEILEMTEEIREDFRREGVIARAVYEPLFFRDPLRQGWRIKGRVYVDGGDELGLLSESLLHEILHATDPDFQNAVKGNLQLIELEQTLPVGETSRRLALKTQIESRRIAYTRATERYAHDGQSEYKKQLAVLFPATRDYFHAHLQRGNSKPLVVTDAMLESSYESQFRWRFALSCPDHLTPRPLPKGRGEFPPLVLPSIR